VATEPAPRNPSSAAARSDRDRVAKVIRLLAYSTSSNDPETLDETLSVLLLSLMGEFATLGSAVLIAEGDKLHGRVAKGSARDLARSSLPLDREAVARGAVDDVRKASGLELIVPILHDGQLHGVLGLAGRGDGTAYVEADVELVRLVASIAGTALTSSVLYERLKTANRRVQRQVFDLHTLFDVSRALNGSLEPEGIFRVVVQTVMAHVLVGRCLIVLEQDGGATVAFARGLTPPDAALAEVDFASASAAPEPVALLELLRPHGIELLLPLRAGDTIRGYLGIGDKKDGNQLMPHEIDFLSTLGNQAITAIDNLQLHVDRARREQLERELDLARDIQQGLLPKNLPELEGYQLAAHSAPCFEVGGDYYDAFLLPTGLVFAIGDVSGKSVPAALLMSVLQATVHALAGRPGETPPSVLTVLNLNLLNSTQVGKFASFFLAQLDLDSGRVSYTNAGHNPPFIARADGSIEGLQSGGPVLGIFDDATFELGSTVLEPGDLMFIYTDGVTEAVDGSDDEFGERRLRDVLARVRANGAEVAVDSVVAAVRQHAEGLPAGDDLTALALVRKAS